jgi:hypothetical protein
MKLMLSPGVNLRVFLSYWRFHVQRAEDRYEGPAHNGDASGINRSTLSVSCHVERV